MSATWQERSPRRPASVCAVPRSPLPRSGKAHCPGSPETARRPDSDACWPTPRAASSFPTRRRRRAASEGSRAHYPDQQASDRGAPASSVDMEERAWSRAASCSARPQAACAKQPEGEALARLRGPVLSPLSGRAKRSTSARDSACGCGDDACDRHTNSLFRHASLL